MDYSANESSYDMNNALESQTVAKKGFLKSIFNKERAKKVFTFENVLSLASGSAASFAAKASVVAALGMAGAPILLVGALAGAAGGLASTSAKIGMEHLYARCIGAPKKADWKAITRRMMIGTAVGAVGGTATKFAMEHVDFAKVGHSLKSVFNSFANPQHLPPIVPASPVTAPMAIVPAPAPVAPIVPAPDAIAPLPPPAVVMPVAPEPQVVAPMQAPAAVLPVQAEPLAVAPVDIAPPPAPLDLTPPEASAPVPAAPEASSLPAVPDAATFQAPLPDAPAIQSDVHADAVFPLSGSAPPNVELQTTEAPALPHPEAPATPLVAAPLSGPLEGPTHVALPAQPPALNAHHSEAVRHYEAKPQHVAHKPVQHPIVNRAALERLNASEHQITERLNEESLRNAEAGINATPTVAAVEPQARILPVARVLPETKILPGKISCKWNLDSAGKPASALCEGDGEAVEAIRQARRITIPLVHLN